MLEHRFQKLIHRIPHAEIMRTRMERATRLVRETDLSLSEIAVRSGFANPNYLSIAFKKQTGLGPRAYRQRLSESVRGNESRLH